jgi:hypothetical protein
MDIGYIAASALEPSGRRHDGETQRHSCGKIRAITKVRLMLGVIAQDSDGKDPK